MRKRVRSKNSAWVHECLSEWGSAWVIEWICLITLHLHIHRECSWLETSSYWWLHVVYRLTPPPTLRFKPHDYFGRCTTRLSGWTYVMFVCGRFVRVCVVCVCVCVCSITPCMYVYVWMSYIYIYCPVYLCTCAHSIFATIDDSLSLMSTLGRINKHNFLCKFTSAPRVCKRNCTAKVGVFYADNNCWTKCLSFGIGNVVGTDLKKRMQNERTTVFE